MAAPISTTYTAEEREVIIAHVIAEVSGGRAVSRILREDEGMPASSQFWGWHSKDRELQERVARARENGVESLLDETLEIADDGSNDWIERQREDGTTYEAFHAEHVQRSKLRIDARREYARMIAPRKYGQKVDVTSSGQPIGPQTTLHIDAKIQAIMVTAARRRDGAELVEDALDQGEQTEDETNQALPGE